MEQQTVTTTPQYVNPSCHACKGTGTDTAFGGSCTQCAYDANQAELMRKRYEGVHTTSSDRAHTPGERLDGRTYGSTSTDPTARQLAYLHKLLNACHDKDHAELVRSKVSTMTKTQASAVIDNLSKLADWHRQQQPTQPAQRSNTRPNRYADVCVTCGQQVAAGAGVLLGRNSDGRWETAHHDGECPEVAAQSNTAPATTGLDLSGVPTGCYAVPGGDTRLKVRIDNVDKGKWDGWVFVKDGAEYGAQRRYGKQRPGGTYQGDITAELEAIAADPKAAAAAYGQLTGTCGRCGRMLEDEDSVARGIGPICMGKF